MIGAHLGRLLSETHANATSQLRAIKWDGRRLNLVLDATF